MACRQCPCTYNDCILLLASRIVRFWIDVIIVERLYIDEIVSLVRQILYLGASPAPLGTSPFKLACVHMSIYSAYKLVQVRYHVPTSYT
jgi:hypothetical protein